MSDVWGCGGRRTVVQSRVRTRSEVTVVSFFPSAQGTSPEIPNVLSETRPRTDNGTQEEGCGSPCRTRRSMSYCKVERLKSEFSLEFRKRCLRRSPGYMRTDIFDSGFRARLESIHPLLPSVRLSGARVDLAPSLSNTGRRVRPVPFIASECIDLR